MHPREHSAAKFRTPEDERRLSDASDIGAQPGSLSVTGRRLHVSMIAGAKSRARLAKRGRHGGMFKTSTRPAAEHVPLAQPRSILDERVIGVGWQDKLSIVC